MVSDHYDWLPDIEGFGIHSGDWEKYLNVLYHIFERDFVRCKPTFRGRKLGLKRHPLYEEKEATFWHFISEGEIESERTPDMRRCERIRWPRPCIESCDTNGVLVWSEARKGEDRIHIYLEHESYLVVLSDRKEYILPWTAYYVERKHQRAKLLKRYADWLSEQS